MGAYTAQLWLTIGAFLLGLALPFVAVLVLDGIVSLFRHRGVKWLVGGIVMTVIVAGAGYALWRVGIDQVLLSANGAAAALGSRDLIRTMLIFTVPTALFMFAVRTIWVIGRPERA